MKIRFSGDIFPCRQAVTYLLPELDLEESESAKFTVDLKQGEKLSLSVENSGAKIEYANISQLCRALGYLKAHIGECGFSVTEKPVFDTLGLMLNCTDAVMHVERLKWLARKMALMGMNTIALYMEDTYEVENEPYFGYMRGRYSKAELKEIDDYCFALGIEIIPFIEGLGHLVEVLKWPAYNEIKNTNDTLLIDTQKTYDFIEKMIVNVMEPLHTKRVSLNLDECTNVCEGVYRQRHGLQNADELLTEHIKKCLQITDKLGYKLMVDSDVYFQAAFGHYYEREKELPQRIIDNFVPGTDVFYWDYYTSDVETYDHMFKLHRDLGSEPILGTGIYTWFGPFPDYTKTLEATIPALTSAKNNGIKEVIATNWASSTNDPSSFLYGLQIHAEFSYTGEYDPEKAKKRFSECCGVTADAFLEMDEFDHIPGDLVGREVNSSGSPKRAENLLWEDPLMPLFEKDFEEFDLIKYYEKFESDFAAYAKEYPEYFHSFDFASKFGRVLHNKCIWRVEAPAAVRSKDREKAKELVKFGEKLYGELDELRNAWHDLWCYYNRPYGYEIYDIRVGGAQSRLKSAIREMRRFADGEIDDIEELSCEKLPFSRNVEGAPQGCVRKQSWHLCASVNTMKKPAFL